MWALWHLLQSATAMSAAVRFVALGALRHLAVDTVTGGTVKGGMFALVVSELSNLLCVAGQTGICDLPANEIFKGVCGFL